MVNSRSKITTRYTIKFILFSICIPIAVIFIIYFLYKNYYPWKVCIWALKEKPTFNFNINAFILIHFIGVLIEFSFHIGANQYFDFYDEKFIENNYVDPHKVNITFPQDKQNLIMLILESMESSFTGNEYGGVFGKNYIPKLTKHCLDPNNIQFSQNDKIGGFSQTVACEWSLGGYMGMFGGLPLKSSLRVPNYRPFIPKAKFILDVLNESGYDQYMILSHSRGFLSTGSFFATHGTIALDTSDIKKSLGKYAFADGGWDIADYVL